MAESPSKKSDRVLSYSLYSDGKDVGSDYRLETAWVRLEANRIGKATLQFDAGDMAGQAFPEAESAVFKPGAKIRLNVGYEGSEKTIFEGLVVALKIEINGQQRSQMVVECRDILFAATLGRKNKVFEKQKDSQVIQTVLSNYGEVEVDQTGFQHPVLVQYYATDWDFALSRADANGLLIFYQGGKIKVKKPKVNAAAVLTVTYGVDLIDFQGGVSATEQFSRVEAVSWDISKQALVKSASDAPSLNAQGNIAVSDLKTGDTFLLQTDAPMETEALKSWVNSVALKNGLARYRGTFSFSGHAAVVPGCIVELKGLGKRLDGKVFAGAVEHRIREQVWTTRVEMGIPPQPITDETDVVCPPASGWLPGIEGLHVGKVKQLEDDPLKEHRILVELPLLNSPQNAVWARLVQKYAGAERGGFFLPEKGDEVVVGFFNNDPRHPVVLGSLYSSKQKPPYALSKDNYKKAIVTKEKLKVVFDEEKKSITIETPGNNKIVLDDDGKSISLADQHKNKVVMNNQGISLESAGKIVLKAKKDIAIEAMGKLTGSAKSDVSLKGMNVKAEAQIGFTAKGNATAELSASGQTVVKGGMVMIN